MLVGMSFMASGLYVISMKSLVLDRVFRCYNEIRLANVVRLKRTHSVLDDTEILRNTAALYGRRQRWPRLKIDSFRLSFIDTDGDVTCRA